MFQRILVPLDGSARAERAVAAAGRLARASGGTVILVEVSNVHLEYGPYVNPGVSTPLVIDRDYDEAVAYLQSLTKGHDLSDLPTEIEVMAGPVAETILSGAAVHRADAIVMSSHGRTGFSRWVLGSVAQKVVRYAPIPVLVLRDAGPELPAPVSGQTLSVLVPLDGSPLAEAVLQPAVELAQALGTGQQPILHLVQVVDVPFPLADAGGLKTGEQIDPHARKSVHAEAKAYLENVAQRLRRALPTGQPLTIVTTVAFDVDAAATIISAAEGGGDAQGRNLAGPCHVIAMATHGRGGLARWAMGSVTERVLDGTRIPMLIVRPAEMAMQPEEARVAEAEASELPMTVPLY